MGDVIKANFRVKLNRILKQFDPNNFNQEYQIKIFNELYTGFPQFKAHVAAFVERRYCLALNDEDHSDPKAVIDLLSDIEVRQQNKWILGRNNVSGIRRN